MTTLIYITLAFFAVMQITFAIGITFTMSLIKKKEVDGSIAIIGMVSVLGLVWSIVSLITFYEILP